MIHYTVYLVNVKVLKWRGKEEKVMCRKNVEIMNEESYVLTFIFNNSTSPPNYPF